ncbi:MAG: hypothetical protein RLY97_1361, partial [Pseudomonadota bacterium]
SHVFYLIRRLTWAKRKQLFPFMQPKLPDDPADDWIRSTQAFLDQSSARIIWLLYPDRHETETQSLPCNDLRAYITGRAHIVDVIHGNGWATDCYSDDIHPNSHGRKFLADYIAKALAEPVTA